MGKVFWILFGPLDYGWMMKATETKSKVLKYLLRYFRRIYDFILTRLVSLSQAIPRVTDYLG